MSSENPTGGDNQQETGKNSLQLDPHWVCGFVDGEGCFSIAFHRNPYVRRTRGWQIYPSFQVSQHRDNREVLEELLRFFGTGKIRDKGPKSAVLVYGVLGLKRVEEYVVPVFERYPLRVKAKDFFAFARIVRLMRAKEHLQPEGFETIARLAYGMNANGKQRQRTLSELLKGSSETAREAHSL